MLTFGAVGHIPDAQALALSVGFGLVVFVAALPGGVLWLMRPSLRKQTWEMAQRSPAAMSDEGGGRRLRRACRKPRCWPAANRACARCRRGWAGAAPIRARGPCAYRDR